MSRYRNAAAIVTTLLLCAAAPAPADNAQGGGHDQAGPVRSLQTNAKFWLAAVKDQCDPAHAPQPELVVTWSGACTNMLMDGPGTLILADKANTHRLTMKALFVRGVADGPQAITFPDGNVFEGVFHDDQPNGHGLMRYPDGSSFEGELRNDLLHGRTRFVNPAGTIIDATYTDGLLDGPWATVFTGGFRTDANYRAGQLDGSSTTTFADGSRLTFDGADGTHKVAATYVTSAGQRVTGAYLPAKPDASVPHEVEWYMGMRELNVNGSLDLEIDIAPDGHVASVALTRSSGIKKLDDFVVAAVMAWRYLPATVAGQPVASLSALTFRRGDKGLVFDEAFAK